MTQQTITIPGTELTQCALHEATGHLYDALAKADLEDEQIPPDVFEAIEDLYIATAENEVSSVRISYELEVETPNAEA